jgi:hypothetical protein
MRAHLSHIAVWAVASVFLVCLPLFAYANLDGVRVHNDDKQQRTVEALWPINGKAKLKPQ